MAEGLSPLLETELSLPCPFVILLNKISGRVIIGSDFSILKEFLLGDRNNDLKIFALPFPRKSSGITHPLNLIPSFNLLMNLILQALDVFPPGSMQGVLGPGGGITTMAQV